MLNVNVSLAHIVKIVQGKTFGLPLKICQSGLIFDNALILGINY